MTNININRRSFMQMLGAGAATLAAGLSAPRVIARTANGVLVQSEEEYGQIIVEKLDKGNFPYRYNPDIIRPFSEKNTVFSRNIWAPDRQNRPETKENLTYINLIENKGLLPDQTRLDYALMQAAWHYARSGSPYGWQPEGSSRMFGRMGPWDPADLDMNWEEATRAVKHAGLFYGASQAGVAELNPLWMYSDHFSPSREDRERILPVLCDGERFEKTEEAWFIPRSLNRVIALAFEEDYSAMASSPGRLASAATGNGYSRMAVTATTPSTRISQQPNTLERGQTPIGIIVRPPNCEVSRSTVIEVRATRDGRQRIL